MQQKSRRTLFIALVIPGIVTAATLVTMLILLPHAPSEIVMQWSGDEPSRYGHPAELLFVPLIAAGISLIAWAALGSVNLNTGSQSPNSQRIAIIIGNAINAALCATAVIMLVTQLGSNADGGLSGILIALIPAAAVGLLTFALVRRPVE